MARPWCRRAVGQLPLFDSSIISGGQSARLDDDGGQREEPNERPIVGWLAGWLSTMMVIEPRAIVRWKQQQVELMQLCAGAAASADSQLLAAPANYLLPPSTRPFN